MTKDKSSSKTKNAVAAPEKKNGDGGRITKSSTTMDKVKTAAKAVVSAAADKAATVAKKNGIIKETKVILIVVWG